MTAAGGKRRKVVHTFSPPDLLIAATPLCQGLTVVTRDAVDFERADVPVLNHCKAD